MITIEEAELLAQTHDLARFTLGMKTPEHDLTSAALRSLAAERDALRAEKARLREAIEMAIDCIEDVDVIGARQILKLALGETQ